MYLPLSIRRDAMPKRAKITVPTKTPMKMRTLAMAVAATLTAASAGAATPFGDYLTLSGFGTVGAVITDNSEDVFVREGAPEGATRAASWKVDTKLGLQADVRADWFGATVQVLTEQRREQPDLRASTVVERGRSRRPFSTHWSTGSSTSNRRRPSIRRLHQPVLSSARDRCACTHRLPSTREAAARTMRPTSTAAATWKRGTPCVTACSRSTSTK